MKKPLYLIVGASGSGKDYIVDKMCRDFDMSRVISRTTRRRRNPMDLHIFVTPYQAGVEVQSSIALSNYNGNLYYVLPQDIYDTDFYIIDVQGVDSIYRKKAEGVECLDRPIEIIFIDSPWYVRFRNMRKRGDKFTDIINRLLLDEREFDDFEGDHNFSSSDDVYDFFKRARKLHVV